METLIMLRITLPDGSQKQLSEPVTVGQVASSIGSGLSKAAIAGEVNGKLVDLSYPITTDAKVRILTGKDPEGLEIIRHSAAHLLAHAVKKLFPSVKVTIGPVIEDGFYYDFDYQESFGTEDLEKIEKKMQELAQANFPVFRKELSRDEASALFEKLGESYKVEIIKNLPDGEVITVYQQEDFVDLCRGPHVSVTGKVEAFKLTKVAGAYWKGDSKNPMLQRIYGTAWQDKKALQVYLDRIAEAEKRDHRKLAKKMDLFHLQPEAPGMVFWHPNGWALVRAIREYLRKRLIEFGYQEINTPQVVDQILWHKSGHMEKFTDDIFCLEADNHHYAIKPMSCPCHVQVYNCGIKSYRDLPIRYSEFGSCHRNEPSGTLHGLLRVRSFVQDDAHIFCTPSQIQEEVQAFIKQLHTVYADFGFFKVIHKLSTRPAKRIGNDEIWDMAEKALAEALNASGVEWQEFPGEGAFYGPKIEFSLHDCLGRVWQCGTMQVDFFTAGRLDATYVTDTGSKEAPVMLHRAIFGSLERFIALLLEEYEGRLPLWLAPVQLVVLNITDRQQQYAKEIALELQKSGFRVNLDLRNEKIGFKIREHTIARIPCQIVVGDREVVENTITLRYAGSQSPQTMDLLSLITSLREQIHLRTNPWTAISAET